MVTEPLKLRKFETFRSARSDKTVLSIRITIDENPITNSKLEILISSSPKNLSKDEIVGDWLTEPAAFVPKATSNAIKAMPTMSKMLRSNCTITYKKSLILSRKVRSDSNVRRQEMRLMF